MWAITVVKSATPVKIIILLPEECSVEPENYCSVRPHAVNSGCLFAKGAKAQYRSYPIKGLYCQDVLKEILADKRGTAFSDLVLD